MNPQHLADMLGVSLTPLRSELIEKLHAAAFSTSKECIAWPRGCNAARGGYGVAFAGWQAHRASLSIKLGRALIHGEVARHTCDNPVCFNGSHLIIGTQSENQMDAIERGRRKLFKAPKGEKCHWAKLTASQVSFMRDLFEYGATTKQLADKFGVSQTAAVYIVRHENWAHVL